MSVADRSSSPAGPNPARGGAQRIPRPPQGVEPGAPAPWLGLDPSLLRPSLGDVRESLARHGPARRSPVELDGFSMDWLPEELRVRVTEVSPRPSAVLVPLYERDGEAWVVLTRRSADLRVHAGEVSFPGGRADDGDRDLVHTALREAEEEIGLDPARVEIIGELDHLATVISGSFIVPWVAALDGVPDDLVPSLGEVDKVLHVPLSELLTPEVFREELWMLGEKLRPLVFFDIPGDTVWGATGAMLRQLLGFVTGTLGRGDLGHD